MKKFPVLIAFAALLIVACLCTGTSPSAPTAQPQTGATVVFESPTETRAPKPTATEALGQTRNNPHPMNTTVEVGDGVLLTINFVKRPADDIVAEGNIFNDTPEPDTEYMIVSLHLECTKPADQTCRFTAGDIKTVGANGTVRDQASVAGIPEEMEYFNEFFGGSMLDGNLVFIATKGDTSTVLYFDPIFGGYSTYISLVQ